MTATGVPVAFAAEISEDRTRCAVCASWRESEGRRRVVAEVAWYGPRDDAVAEIVRLYEKHEPVDVVIDGRSQSATLLKPLADAGVLVRQPSTQDVVVAHGNFMDLVDAGGLVHLNQEELTAAVRGAQQRKLGGAQALERRVAVDQSPLVAAELAVQGLLAYEGESDPGAWVI